MKTENLTIVRETEKAIQFEIGFKASDRGELTGYGFGYIVKSWVPKSVIKDGAIAEWFAQKEFPKAFGSFRPAIDILFN